MTEARPQELDLEELAAYVDGRLTGERKTRVEEILVRDEDAYEIFLGTVAFEEASAEPSAPAEPVRLVRPWLQSSWRAAGALVAAALVAGALGVLLQWALFDRGPVAGPQSAELAPSAALPKEWHHPVWPNLRGGGENDQSAFRLGIRVFDLHVALGASDRALAKRLVPTIESLAKQAGASSALGLYSDLATKIGRNDVTDEELEDLAEQREADLAESLALTRFDLGRFAEAGRLAALAEDAEVFERRAFRRYLKQAIEDPTNEDIAANLRAIEKLLEQDQLDHEVLREEFRKLIYKAG